MGPISERERVCTYLLPTSLPTTYLLLPTYYYLPTYNLPTTYLPNTYLLPTYYLPNTYLSTQLSLLLPAKLSRLIHCPLHPFRSVTSNTTLMCLSVTGCCLCHYRLNFNYQCNNFNYYNYNHLFMLMLISLLLWLCTSKLLHLRSNTTYLFVKDSQGAFSQ